MVRVEYEPDPVTGKRRQRSETFRLRKDAEKRLTAWLAELDRGTAIDPSKLTVAELFRQWLDDIAAHAVRQTTLAGYRWQIEKHIIPNLGHILVQRLTAARIQAFYSAKLEAGDSPHAVHLIHLRLNQALAQAVKWSIVPANVCASVDPPRFRHKKSETWDADQLRTFLATAEHDTHHPLWLVLATTGMRRGEALGLRWKDLDLDRGMASIRQSVVSHAGGPLIHEPKTPGARRSVRLLPEVVAALRAYRTDWITRKLAAPPELWEDHNLIFCTAFGQPITPNNLNDRFNRLVRMAGIPRIRIHDLRHTHATLLLQGGTPVKVVSERLGHTKISITLDTYAHVLPDMQDRAVELFSDIIGKGTG